MNKPFGFSFLPCGLKDCIILLPISQMTNNRAKAGLRAITWRLNVMLLARAMSALYLHLTGKPELSFQCHLQHTLSFPNFHQTPLESCWFVCYSFDCDPRGFQSCCSESQSVHVPHVTPVQSLKFDREPAFLRFWTSAWVTFRSPSLLRFVTHVWVWLQGRMYRLMSYLTRDQFLVKKKKKTFEYVYNSCRKCTI